jgi:membrane protein insertase Oxa1/YidC/SpoIIIJ
MNTNGIYRSTTQVRAISSWLPEAVQEFSIWGGTGAALKAIHFDGAVPYWACFAIMNAGLRTALVPLVLYSAKMSSRFAKVAPEVQFIVTLFQNDLQKMRAEGKTLYEQRYLFLQNLQTIRGVYKLHNINPLMVFISPLIQIPFFYYAATDLRKIVNGADPALAQELTESTFYWVPDLTDPDPWFGLPIAAGVMLYTNVEVAIGKRSLSGPTTAKSDFAGLLKDAFQTLAVFMPCFSSQSPAGLQIYLVSSFTYTMFQSAGLRNHVVREWIGLPSLGAAPTEPKYAKEFMEFKKLEQKAKEIRGDGPVLGRNVLAVGFETSFPGSKRKSTIETNGVLPPETVEPAPLPQKPKLDIKSAQEMWGGQFIHGVSAPMDQLEAQTAEHFKEQQAKEVAEQKLKETSKEYIFQASDDAMEAANKGVVIIPRDNQESKTLSKIDAKQYKKRAGKKGRRKK